MQKSEKVFVYTLAVLLGIAAALVLLACSNYGAVAETQNAPGNIVYTRYDGAEMYGLAEVYGDGQRWVKLTFFLREGGCFLAYLPIGEEGEFSGYILCDCAHLGAEVVNEPPGAPCRAYPVYDSLTHGGILW